MARESKSLEGIRGRRPQVPPDDDLVCESLLLLSPQNSVSTFRSYKEIQSLIELFKIVLVQEN